MGKSYIQESVGQGELETLVKIATDEEAAFFARNPHLVEPYRARLLAIAQCQGAALQYLGRGYGVSDRIAFKPTADRRYELTVPIAFDRLMTAAIPALGKLPVQVWRPQRVLPHLPHAAPWGAWPSRTRPQPAPDPRRPNLEARPAGTTQVDVSGEPPGSP